VGAPDYATIVTTASTEEALVLALSDAERRVTRRLANVLAHHGCTVERWRALALLARDESHGMSELAEFTQLPAASVTRLVDGLVADNLAHRKADPHDRRRVLVHLTRRGSALLRQLSDRIAAERDAIFGDVDQDDVARLLGSLAGLLARLR
jgi:DNA-binding MarR family transcriptional regulator